MTWTMKEDFASYTHIIYYIHAHLGIIWFAFMFFPKCMKHPAHHHKSNFILVWQLNRPRIKRHKSKFVKPSVSVYLRESLYRSHRPVMTSRYFEVSPFHPSKVVPREKSTAFPTCNRLRQNASGRDVWKIITYDKKMQNYNNRLTCLPVQWPSCQSDPQKPVVIQKAQRVCCPIAHAFWMQNHHP